MRIMLRNLLLSLTLFTTPACARRNEIIIPPNSVVATEAWHTALRLSDAPPQWTSPRTIVRIDAVKMESTGERNLGYYFFYFEPDKRGALILHEQILVFVRVNESLRLLRNVLIHEDLHAIYLRLSVDPSFASANPSSEIWVCVKGACPVDVGAVDIGAIPATTGGK